jgi:site-specific DNA-cytosine methylase
VPDIARTLSAWVGTIMKGRRWLLYGTRLWQRRHGEYSADNALTGPDGHQSGGHGLAIATASGARRLTPRECEPLQGFPDDYSLIPGNVLTARAIKPWGTVWLIPVMRWIGQRIEWWGGSGQTRKNIPVEGEEAAI